MGQDQAKMTQFGAIRCVLATPVKPLRGVARAVPARYIRT